MVLSGHLRLARTYLHIVYKKKQANGPNKSPVVLAGPPAMSAGTRIDLTFTARLYLNEFLVGDSFI